MGRILGTPNRPPPQMPPPADPAGSIPFDSWGISNTVSGSTTSPATNVLVNGVPATLYADNSFYAMPFGVTNGPNTYTAIARDTNSNISTNTSTVYVIPTNGFYAYDSNGNLTFDGYKNFAYDDENELIGVWVSNAWSNSFAYDGKMRRRIERDYSWDAGTSGWQETNEVHFIYDGKLVAEERNASNIPLVSYTRGNDLGRGFQGAGGIGGLLARTTYGQELPGAPTTSFYHADGNGNITALIYPNQQLAAKYLYDPFGNMLAMSGPLMSFNKYRFSSKEWNDNSGLYYYGYRFYDPSLQRWLNRDPLGELGGLNLYEFVGNQPLDAVDLFGLSCPTKADCDKAYDDAMNQANQAGLACLESGIEWGIGGEVVLGGGGVIIGGIFGNVPGAGTGFVIGTGVNMGIDFLHIHHCEQKVDKMKKDAEDARNNCYKQAGVKPGDYNDS
jgi:RHS repeat-associated protein